MSAIFALQRWLSGLAYNANSKRWEGVSFKPGKAFVLRMKFVAERQEKVITKEETVQDFETTLTEAGTSQPRPCYNLKTFKTVTTVNSFNSLACNSSFTEYRFDFDSNRFIGAYLVGYVGGEDTNKDTPYVTGGTCTKID